MAPKPPSVRGAAAEPWRPSGWGEVGPGGPDMAPKPPSVRGTAAEPWRPSGSREVGPGGSDMAPKPPSVRGAPAQPWLSSGSREVEEPGSSGTEELDEALLDLLVALLQLVGIHVQEPELRELRLVVRVLHLGVTRVEPLAVGHHLLQLAGEREVGEELGRVRMRGESGDRRRRDHQRHAF